MKFHGGIIIQNRLITLTNIVYEKVFSRKSQEDTFPGTLLWMVLLWRHGFVNQHNKFKDIEVTHWLRYSNDNISKILRVHKNTTKKLIFSGGENGEDKKRNE